MTEVVVILGLFDRFTPKFVRRYANLSEVMRGAFAAYRDDVKARRFPAAEHEFPLADEVWEAIQPDGE